MNSTDCTVQRKYLFKLYMYIVLISQCTIYFTFYEIIKWKNCLLVHLIMLCYHLI